MMLFTHFQIMDHHFVFNIVFLLCNVAKCGGNDIFKRELQTNPQTIRIHAHYMEIELNSTETGRLEEALKSVINRVSSIFKGNFNNAKVYTCAHLILRYLMHESINFYNQWGEKSELQVVLILFSESL